MGNSLSKTVYQHNMITQARYDMSVYELNLFFLLLSKLDKTEKSNKLYRVAIKELEEGVGKEININQLRAATSSLRSKEYCLVQEDGSYLQVGILASAEYMKGEGIIELELSRKMEPYLFELKDNFTTYQLFTALQLNSKYSKRLYQILSQFKHTGYYVTSIEKLKTQLMLIDPKTGKEKYTEFGMLRKKVLDVAMRELTETDIKFTYKASKKGRKYAKLEFFIQHNPASAKKKAVPEVDLDQQPIIHKEETPQANKRLLYDRLLNDYKLSREQIKQVFTQFSVKEINKVLYDLQFDFRDRNVKNKQAYTLKRFEMTKQSVIIS